MPYLLILGVPLGLSAFGYFTDKVGEGIDSASNGVIKLGIAAGAGFFILKKAKVI